MTKALEVIKKWKNNGHKIFMTSGGFDPIHIGHIRCIRETAKMAAENNGKVVIIVNGDEFLTNKKGNIFMPIEERLEIIGTIKGVDLAVEWYDGTQYVSEAIALFLPDYFTKGGDRSDPSVVPEWDICKKIGCKVIFGVGGGKVQSSSWLVK